MKTADMGPDGKELSDALSALARVDQAQGAPSHVEQAVMRQWRSVRAGKTGSGLSLITRKPALALVASLILGLSLGGWWVRRDVEPLSVGSQPDAVVGEAAGHSYEMISWLDPDPESLQIVRLRVSSETLRTQGYEVGDPDGDGTVEIEMVLGSDGMARSVLVTSDETPMR
jgi:hypothetical protein